MDAEKRMPFGPMAIALGSWLIATIRGRAVVPRVPDVPPTEAQRGARIAKAEAKRRRKGLAKPQKAPASTAPTTPAPKRKSSRVPRTRRLATLAAFEKRPSGRQWKRLRRVLAHVKRPLTPHAPKRLHVNAAPRGQR